MNTDTTIERQENALTGQNVIQLPFGLLGFERVKNYVLLTNPQEAPFLWLRMLDSARKAFLVVSPFLILPHYGPDIPTDDVEFLGLTEPSDALLYNICTVHGPGRATINLKGPIVLNRHTWVGKQVIPNNAMKYAVDYPLPVG
jgi:flagellar assembly factor FliW